MNEFFGYRYNPSYTPEPHFIPGYGGYLPGVMTRFGLTYGSVSHEVSKKEPVVAARLAHLEPHKDNKGDRVTLDYIDGQKERIPSIEQDKRAIPEYVCPGYMGFLNLKKKGVPLNRCCDGVLRTLGCQQDPYDIPEGRREDPFPGPPPTQSDLVQGRKRCKNGMWMRC